MCWSCVLEYADEEAISHDDLPTISERPAVREAAAAVSAFYDLPGCESGGPLHIVVDDTNIEDRWIIEPWPDWPDTARHYDELDEPTIERVMADAGALLALLRPLTLTERAVATVDLRPPRGFATPDVT